MFLVVATPPLFFPSCSGHSLSQKFNFIIINTKTITKTWTFFNCVVKIVNHHISHQFSFIHYCASVRNEWNISLDNFIKHISTTYISEECKSIIKYHFRFKKNAEWMTSCHGLTWLEKLFFQNEKTSCLIILWFYNIKTIQLFYECNFFPHRNFL